MINRAILSPELGHTVVEEIDGRTIIANSPPWWRLTDGTEILCVTYTKDEEVAVSEMLEWLIADTGEFFFRIYDTADEALARWAAIQPTYWVHKCGSKISYEIPVTEIFSHL